MPLILSCFAALLRVCPLFQSFPFHRCRFRCFVYCLLLLSFVSSMPVSEPHSPLTIQRIRLLITCCCSRSLAFEIADQPGSRISCCISYSLCITFLVATALCARLCDPSYTINHICLNLSIRSFARNAVRTKLNDKTRMDNCASLFRVIYPLDETSIRAADAAMSFVPTPRCDSPGISRIAITNGSLSVTLFH